MPQKSYRAPSRKFGGSSTAEFGPLLRTLYPEAGFTTAVLINNFNSGDMRNPCRA
jgi:hypothetical protein